MEQEQLATTPKKPGPKPKAKIDVEALQERIDKLETFIIELGTHTGYSSVLRKHGYDTYKPTKQDMTRFK